MMKKEHIPHRELLIDWLEDPTQEVWARPLGEEKWQHIADPFSYWFSTVWEIELRPAKRMVKIPGAVIPAPMAEAPEEESSYWSVEVAVRPGARRRGWSGGVTGYATLENNCTYATESDARAAYEAMTRRVEVCDDE